MNAIELKGVGKRYRLGGRQQSYLTLRDALASIWRGRSNMAGAELWALRDIDLAIPACQLVGIVGRNGAGKSTLLKLITKITAPTTGVVRTRGRVGALLEVGTGFHPELTGRENVFLNAGVLGMPRRETRRQFDEIVTFAGVEEFIDTPLKRYSTGMRLRLAFAVAAHIMPPIIVVDEVLAVADAEFQKRCLGKMAELGSADRTVLFVSHDLGAIAQLCQRVLWIDAGVIKADGRPQEVIERYVDSSASLASQRDLAGSPTDRVRLLEVAAVDRDGHLEPRPVRGDPLAIRVAFAIEEDLRGLDVAVWLDDRRGNRVIEEAYADATGGVPALNLERGDYAITVQIAPVLPAGQYVVGLWFGTSHDDLLIREVMTIDIAARVEDRTESLERRRAIQPPVSWNLDQLLLRP